MNDIKKDLVSVIIPAFNRDIYIEKTIESVLIQSYFSKECLVVDDGSTDRTYDLITRMESKDLRVLVHNERRNCGQSASINLALRHARGEYIAILDSDDLFAPNKLEKQVRFLEENPDVGLVYGMGQAIDGEGRYLYDILSPDHIEPNDPNEVLLDCYFLLPQNALVRRSVFDRVGQFEEGFRAAQDHDMLIRIAEVTTMAFIPEILFYYRRHGDSISSNGQETRWLNGFEILRRAAKRYPYRKSTIRKRAAVLNYRLWETYSQQGRRALALSYLVRAGLLDPARSVRVLLGRE